MSNPFTKEYLDEEVKFYGLSEYEENGIKIKTREIIGRCDEFFNKAYSTGNFFAPILFIDGEVWMSLTAMELQSHYLAINRAKGKVGTGGLGMGYFTLRVAAKEEVTKVDVYEKDERVVNFFKKNFSDRKGFNKINFIIGDVNKNLYGKVYDYFFMDVYISMDLTEDMLEARANFLENNTIKKYQWWGEEKVVLQAYLNSLIKAKSLERDEAELFKMWVESGKSNLYDTDFSDRMVRDTMTEIGRR